MIFRANWEFEVLCVDAQGGPGHVIWEAGMVLSRYLVDHPGMDSFQLVTRVICALAFFLSL